MSHARQIKRLKRIAGKFVARDGRGNDWWRRHELARFKDILRKRGLRLVVGE